MEHKYANSIECKFSLETDVDTFARRIVYLTRSIYLHDFDTDDGFISLQTADIAYSDQLDRPHVVYIAGRYYTLKEGAQVAEDPSNLVSMIRFALSPLPTKPQRIKVIATCSEPAVESCLKYLLKDIWQNSEEAREGIEQCWPEAYEDRKATIAQLAAEIKTTLGDLRKEIDKPTAGEATSRRQAPHVSTKHDTAALTPAEATDRLTSQQVQTEPPKRTRANAGDAEPPFSGFPKTQEGIQKWRESFRVIREKREEYRVLYNAGGTNEPNPSYDDLRDALARMPEWKKKPCLSTVQRIVRAGDKGLLE
jgi:uncharacterized protein (DUF2132 family)